MESPPLEVLREGLEVALTPGDWSQVGLHDLEGFSSLRDSGICRDH